MKTKLVYVVVSTAKDYYLEQAYLSMYSAKKVMPDCHIVMLTDTTTQATLTGTRAKEVQYADDVVAVDLDPERYNGQKRSRILKTSVRNHIDGDFLFIDSDTVVVKPLDVIDEFPHELGLVRDTHATLADSPFYDFHLIEGEIFGFPIAQERDYFNTGVIYVKDTPAMHEFYRQWNANLLRGHEKGVTMDQPSFAFTNYTLGHVAHHLDDVWNVQFKYAMKYIAAGKILHYLCTNKSANAEEQLFILNDLAVFEHIKESGEVPEFLDALIADPFTAVAACTHSFAGRDVWFFHTGGFQILRDLYDTPCYRYAILALRCVRKGWHLLSKIGLSTRGGAVSFSCPRVMHSLTVSFPWKEAACCA